METKGLIIRTASAAVLAAVTIIGSTSVGVAEQIRTAELQVADTTTSRSTDTVALANDDQFGTLKAPEPEEVVLTDFTPEQPVVLQSTEVTSLTGSRTSKGSTTFDAADDFKAGPGCSIQCITSGKAYARGVGAKLVVKTDTEAYISLVVSADGYYNLVESDGKTMEFDALFNDLDPHTTYDVMVVAEDGQGYLSHAFGSFETLTRNVEIAFTSAQINDAPYGNDLYFLDIWAEGQWLYNNVGPLDPEGNTLPLGIYFINLEDVDRYLDFAIQLRQFDEGQDICEVWAGLSSPSIGSESDSCLTYAYASEFLGETDLDDRPADATSWTEHAFEHTLVIPFGYNSSLDFSVDVTFTVTYE